MRLRQRCLTLSGKSRADKKSDADFEVFCQDFMFLISLRGTPFFLHFLTPVFEGGPVRIPTVLTA